LIASVEGHTRADVDAFAVESQRRTAVAVQGGHFRNSLIPVHDVAGKIVLDHDEHPRPDTTMQTLASLKPSFAQFGAMGFDAVAIQRYPQLESINHVHHAGNSSGIVDGAAAVLLGTKEMGERLGKKPRARIRAYSSIGSEPAIMLTAPAEVTRKVLKRAGMKAGDIDLYEVNEAFASVVLRFMRIMEVPHDKVNVNGGAIALGHPLGATGAMLLGTALDELERRNLNTALITLCIGMGMGTATIIERV
jgi:acetyl-CoA C-acetyltransferase